MIWPGGHSGQVKISEDPSKKKPHESQDDQVPDTTEPSSLRAEKAEPDEDTSQTPWSCACHVLQGAIGFPKLR